MSTEKNIQTVHDLEAAWDAGKLDDVEQYFTSDYVSHAGIEGLPATFETFKMAHTMSLGAMPDRKVEILDTVAGGDKVVVRCRMSGTNKGGFPWFGVGADEGKVSAEYVSIYRLEDGKIAEHWAVIDGFTLLAQIGAWAPPPMPA